MTKKEELKAHLEKYAELKKNFEIARHEMIAFNKVFEAWLGGVTHLAETKGEVHISEILAKWDEFSNV